MNAMLILTTDVIPECDTIQDEEKNETMHGWQHTLSWQGKKSTAPSDFLQNEYWKQIRCRGTLKSYRSLKLSF